MRKNTLLKKLNGYQRAPRGRFKWLFEKVLSQEELILYELGVAITDWDEDHKDTYGSFDATNQELAEMLGWKSDTTAGRYKNSLIKKKVFIVREDRRIEPKGFDKWQIRKRKDAKTQEEDAKTKDQAANIETNAAKMEENQPQDPGYTLGSYKGTLGSFENSETITDDELDRIAEIFDVKEGDS